MVRATARSGNRGPVTIAKLFFAGSADCIWQTYRRAAEELTSLTDHSTSTIS